MNAVTNTTPDLVEENAGGSDSDTNSDEAPQYYQPISDDGDFSDQNSDQEEADRDPSNFNRLPNGYVENGVRYLDLSDDGEDEDEEEEEEERMRAASASAVRRAFREDESRRRAPLTAENATRVMEAMRGVSFGGVAPDWAARVPESQWIQQLRSIRQASTGTSSSAIRN